MKKTLFALLACATLAAPAMAKEWEVIESYMGAYDGDPVRNLENYTFYTFYLDTEDITTTISNNTLAEFKTTYGQGYRCNDDYGAQLAFSSDCTVTTPSDSRENIWGVVVYENGDDALFSAALINESYSRYIYADYYDGDNAYVSFKPESPATPEPATATLSLLALAGLASRRRRK